MNTNIHVGVGARLFDLAYLLGVSNVLRFPRLGWHSCQSRRVSYPVQFTLASVVYFTVSRLFPAHETMLDRAILEQETPPDDGSYSGSDEKKVDCQVDDV
jgi:hypothetical protein